MLLFAPVYFLHESKNVCHEKYVVSGYCSVYQTKEKRRDHRRVPLTVVRSHSTEQLFPHYVNIQQKTVTNGRSHGSDKHVTECDNHGVERQIGLQLEVTRLQVLSHTES